MRGRWRQQRRTVEIPADLRIHARVAEARAVRPESFSEPEPGHGWSAAFQSREWPHPRPNLDPQSSQHAALEGRAPGCWPDAFDAPAWKNVSWRFGNVCSINARYARHTFSPAGFFNRWFLRARDHFVRLDRKSADAPAPKENRPNILFCIADDWSWPPRGYLRRQGGEDAKLRSRRQGGHPLHARFLRRAFLHAVPRGDSHRTDAASPARRRQPVGLSAEKFSSVSQLARSGRLPDRRHAQGLGTGQCSGGWAGRGIRRDRTTRVSRSS